MKRKYKYSNAQLSERIRNNKKKVNYWNEVIKDRSIKKHKALVSIENDVNELTSRFKKKNSVSKKKKSN